MSDLSRRMAALYDRKVVQRVEKQVRATALDLLGTLKVRTPVDTGRARANWHLDIGSPSVQLIAPGGDPTPSFAGYSIEKTVFISNNVPYIRRLNEGHSQQAPAGFVEDSITAVRARIR